MSGTQRLFLALWPDDTVRAALAHARSTWSWPAGAALVAPAKLHLTLHFLGELPRAVVDAVQGAWPAAPSFDLLLGEAQVWPGGVAVLVPHAPPQPLLDLHAALGSVLRDHGLPVEARRFRPHVTFARRAAGARPPAGDASIAWPVRGYALVRSVPGAGYEVLERFA